MADEDRPREPADRPGGQPPAYDDARYFGPFFTGPGYPDYPAPTGVQPLQPLPPEQPPAPAPRSRTRTGAALLITAALLALVVGGAAGFGGARLAARTATPGPAGSGSANASPSEPPSTTAPTPVEPSPEPTAPPPDPNRARQIDTVAVARNVLPGTVMIRAGGNGSNGSTGSGFVLDTSGRILTNNHVVAKAANRGRITVTFADGRRAVASLVGRSSSYDVAVIKVATGRPLNPIPLGNSEASQVGEPVVAVGSPLGLPGTVTQGIISAKNRPVVVREGNEARAPTAYINGIQTDAPINPGNSGGPLIDAGGRVIGVNSAILTLSGSETTPSGNIGLGFAIPIKQAMQIGRLLIRDGKATYPIIGADVSDGTSGGVEVVSIQSDGPADRAGLRVGDLVTRIDRLPVSSRDELIVAIRTHRPGESVTLAYERGTTRGRAVVTLGSKEG